MKELSEVLSELKSGQSNTERVKTLLVDDWKCSVKIRKLTLSDMIYAEDYGFSISGDGTKKTSESKREAILVCLAVESLQYPRDMEFLEEMASAGTVRNLLNQIMLFSGFNNSIDEMIETKKKD